MLGYWCAAANHTYVAIVNGNVAGSFLIKDNQPDLGSHVANGAYMVLPGESGQGIGKAMGAFSIEEQNGLDINPCSLIWL